MEVNKPALKTLSVLLIVVAFLFSIEKHFLVPDARGEAMSNYSSLKWNDNIVLLIDDFEGLTDSVSLVKTNFFGYGNCRIIPDSLQTDGNAIALKTCLKVQWEGKNNFGGWGKGVGKNIDINTATDHLNFRIFSPKTNTDTTLIKIMLEEDDDFNGKLEQDKDDSWFYKLPVISSDKWQLISIPLTKFTDGNAGGDGQLNITRKGGLHTVIFAYENTDKYKQDSKWYFDFICFTNGIITE
jgi:hypothetical protein